jgi:hypothetical protein
MANLILVVNGLFATCCVKVAQLVQALTKTWLAHCRNPTLAKCGGEAQHLEKVGIGVVASLAFRLRLRQGG